MKITKIIFINQVVISVAVQWMTPPFKIVQTFRHKIIRKILVGMGKIIYKYPGFLHSNKVFCK